MSFFLQIKEAFYALVELPMVTFTFQLPKTILIFCQGDLFLCGTETMMFQLKRPGFGTASLASLQIHHQKLELHLPSLTLEFCSQHASLDKRRPYFLRYFSFSAQNSPHELCSPVERIISQNKNLAWGIRKTWRKDRFFKLRDVKREAKTAGEKKELNVFVHLYFRFCI